MAREVDPLDLLGREPDEQLLGEERGQLPASAGEPETVPETPARRRIVAFGAAMTGGTLVIGSLLTVVAFVQTLSSGFALGWVVVLVCAILLVATHWGWVHVAELTAGNIEGHRNTSLLERRRAWLREIAPYPRWEVTTRVGDDGSITILTDCSRPVLRGDSRYSFVREQVAREVHSGEEPAAAVSERAENLRRQAAEDTERERQRFEAARDAYEQALLARDDEEQRRAALRAASEALSERINANLRDPPLVE